MQSALRFSSTQKDTGSNEPVEFKIDEDELFSEKKMKEAQVSIGEKLKAIKKAQEAKGDDDHVHDASKFSFIKTSKLENVHSGAYFYG